MIVVSVKFKCSTGYPMKEYVSHEGSQFFLGGEKYEKETVRRAAVRNYGDRPACWLWCTGR